jgi:hypothetical protein
MRENNFCSLFALKVHGVAESGTTGAISNPNVKYYLRLYLGHFDKFKRFQGVPGYRYRYSLCFGSGSGTGFRRSKTCENEGGANRDKKFKKQ